MSLVLLKRRSCVVTHRWGAWGDVSAVPTISARYGGIRIVKCLLTFHLCISMLYLVHILSLKLRFVTSWGYQLCIKLEIILLVRM